MAQQQATELGRAAIINTLHSGLEAASTVADHVEGLVDNKPIVSVVVGVAGTPGAGTMPGVMDAAGQVVAGLLALADRFPLASQCGGVLKDLFALYQVCPTPPAGVISTACGWYSPLGMRHPPVAVAYRYCGGGSSTCR